MKSGKAYSGEFKEDMKHGFCTTCTCIETDQHYEGFFYMDEKHVYGKNTWSDGTNYKGEWRKGAMHGQGVFIWHTGDKYEGQFKDNMQHGIG